MGTQLSLLCVTPLGSVPELLRCQGKLQGPRNPRDEALWATSAYKTVTPLTSCHWGTRAAVKCLLSTKQGCGLKGDVS